MVFRRWKTNSITVGANHFLNYLLEGNDRLEWALEPPANSPRFLVLVSVNRDTLGLITKSTSYWRKPSQDQKDQRAEGGPSFSSRADGDLLLLHEAAGGGFFAGPSWLPPTSPPPKPKFFSHARASFFKPEHGRIRERRNVFYRKSLRECIKNLCGTAGMGWPPFRRPLVRFLITDPDLSCHYMKTTCRLFFLYCLNILQNRLYSRSISSCLCTVKTSKNNTGIAFNCKKHFTIYTTHYMKNWTFQCKSCHCCHGLLKIR